MNKRNKNKIIQDVNGEDDSFLCDDDTKEQKENKKGLSCKKTKKNATKSKRIKNDYKFWNLKRMVLYALHNRYVCTFIILLACYTALVVLGIIFDISSFLHWEKFTSYLIGDAIALGSCSIAAILAFMTILSIGITIQNNEYYGINISDIFASRNPKKSFGFGFEIATLLYLSLLIFVEMMYKCSLLIEITMCLSFIYCFLLWYFESRVVVRDDEYIYKSLKNAYRRYVQKEQDNFSEIKMDKYFSEFIYFNDISKLIEEDSSEENIEFLLTFIFKGLQKNASNVDYQKKMLQQLKIIIDYCDNDKFTYVTIFSNNCLELVKLIQNSLNEECQYEVYYDLISLLLDYSGNEKYKFAALSFLTISRYAVENVVKSLLSVILDNLNVFRLNMNRVRTLYFGVFIYLYELATYNKYSSYTDKDSQELLISFMKSNNLDYGNSYINRIEYFFGTYKFDEDAKYCMDFFTKIYPVFQDDKHPEYTFFDTEVLLNIFFSKMIFFDEKFELFETFNEGDTFGYFANYCYSFFSDLLMKDISNNVKDPLVEMLEFYGNYSFLYFVDESPDKLERIKSKMFDIVNELLKDRNERFNNSDHVNNFLQNNNQEIVKVINEIFIEEFDGLKNCKPKGTTVKEKVIFPVLDFPLVYDGIEGIAQFIYNYHIMEYLKKYIRSKKKFEDILPLLTNSRLSSFYTNIPDFTLRQELDEKDYLKLKKKRIFFDSYLFKPHYIIKNNNFYIGINNLSIDSTDYTDDELDSILNSNKHDDGYYIMGAVYNKEEAIDAIKKNYRKLTISFDFEYYFNGLFLAKNL